MDDLDLILDMASAQGSKTWHDQRVGRFTASRFGDLLTNNRTGDGMGQVALKYLYEVATERLTGQPVSIFGGKAATDWGSEWEATARNRAQEKLGAIAVPGFLVHSTYVGGSPDGLTDDAVLEIKCPYNPVNHTARLLAKECPEEYYAQLQGNIWIADRAKGYYIDFDPRFPVSSQLLIVEVPRDDAFIAKLQARIAEATNLLNDIINKLK